MNIRSETGLSTPDFLRWAKRQEGRYELVRGRPVAVTPTTRNHGTVKGNLTMSLVRALPSEHWTVLCHFAVQVDGSIRSPDILVEPAGGDGDGRISEAPVLLAEVLSPSSLETDLHEKAGEYTALPSLRAYVVLAQDEPRLWLWQRGEDGAFPHAGTMIEGADAVLEIPALGLALPLADIWRGVR